ncbi:BamA/TamA family outer membrane protein [Reinekea marina]|uniref:BamA/TamA family outer membrane protein n=1 Tax=Reinekea marina TaxID=1310421 RepID=A0ABV7WNP2_9GAMM|nr:BamA/TamA family outer membrane protein [Reinekea marina]MDN3648623.1 BamA/TamA family outer membrane protein [Reinekea marina]
MKKLFLAPIICMAALSSADSLKPAAWVPLPAVGSSPETGFQYGAYVMRIFEQTSADQPQDRLELLLQGTTQGQYQAYIWPNMFLDGGLWNLKGKLGGRYWPSGYFGQGNATEEEADQYANTTLEGSITANYLITPDIRIGASLRVENHEIEDIADPDGSESSLIDANVIGANGGLYSGVGAELIYDKRDNIDWPTQGNLSKATWDLYPTSLGSDANFSLLNARSAHYFSIADDVFAFSAQLSLASEDTPFTHLPRPSGDGTLRGANGQRWIDNASVGAQAEFRKAISNRWAAVVFTDTFQVASDLDQFALSDFHYSIGGGIRFATTPDRFNVRLDVGFVDFESFNFAITVGEAF